MKEQLTNRLKDINENLPALLIGEGLFLAAGELIIWLFVSEEFEQTAAIGLLLGVLLAMAGSVFLALTIQRALNTGTRAVALLLLFLRFGLLALILLFCLLKDPWLALSVLIGLLSEQTGVYLVPLFEKKEHAQHQRKEKE